MLEGIARSLAESGLALIGPVPARAEDALSEAAPGRPARSILLAANTGSAFWPHFTASKEYSDGGPDPLNRWSFRVVREAAQEFGLTAISPFQGPPFWPFQRWAARAGGFSQSPLGVLAHERYGPWVAFRGALLSPEPCPEPPPAPGPCESCIAKPCLDACPSGALARGQAYRPDVCRSHIRGEGRETCGAHGCLVRHACPVGRGFAYRPEQARFHMTAFINR